jgi:folate-dependent phosphoribosylglycinamide formyltransferase PurN
LVLNHEKNLKIGILTEPILGDFRKTVFDELLELDHQFFFFVDESPSPPLNKKIKYHFRKKRGGYMLVMFLKNFFTKKTESFHIDDIMTKKEYLIFKSDDPYSNNFVKLIKSNNIDLLINISGFGRMIKKSILDIPKIGTLSFHHGDLTKYRGQPAGFWELYHGEKSMSITVQLLSEKLDAGIPIVVKAINIKDDDTLISLKQKLYQESYGLLTYAINELINNNSSSKKKVNNLGKVYTIPNLKQWVKFQFIILKRKIYFWLNK